MLTILALIILLAFSAFFSASETALMLMQDHKINILIKKKYKTALLLKKIKKDSQRFLITILVGNNLVNIAASAIATTIAINYFGNVGAGIAVGIMTFLILIFGEILPKTFASKNYEKIALYFVYPVYVIQIILYPIVKVFEFIANLFLMITRKGKNNPKLTEEEIISILRLGSEKKIIDRGERELMENIIDMDETKVTEIMTKKENIFMLNADNLVSDSVERINKMGYSRIPIFDQGTKEVIGFVHILDILRNINNKTCKLKDIKKDLLFVKNNIKLDDVLKIMQDNGIHILGVKNDTEHFIGIITLEDVMEDVFGEIYDESDITPVSPLVVNKNIIISHITTQIKTLNPYLEDLIPKEYNNLTLREFLLKRLEFKANKSIIIYGLKFKINSIIKNKPRLIKIIIQREKK